MDAAPRMHWLRMTTYVIVSVSALVWIATHIWTMKHQSEVEARAAAEADSAKAEALAKELLARPMFAKMEMHAYSTAEFGRAVITNTSDTPKYECMRSIMISDATAKSTSTIEVCSGTVPPHSTTTIEMPYDVGAVHTLCDGKPDGYGNRHIDWSLCTFTVEPLLDVPPLGAPVSATPRASAPSSSASVH
jgi:hypothetical protein